MSTIKNILVVNVNWLGDVIFASPVFRALKEQYPNANIVCMAVPRVHEILECIPEIDEILNFDEDGAHKSWIAKWKFAKMLKAQNFDVAFLLRPSRSRAMILKLAKIPNRVGYAKGAGGDLLTHFVDSPDESLHRSDYYLRVIEAFDVAVKEKRAYLKPDETVLDEVASLLKEAGLKNNTPFIVINPGGNWDLKRWPVEHYIELTKNLLKTQKRSIVLSGAPKDEPLGERIQGAISDDRFINMIGATNLKQAVALMKMAELVICADSGPLHIANSVGTKAIGLFGPTRPEVTGPKGSGITKILQRDVGCNLQPCYYLECPNNVCMQAISVQDVIDAAEQIQS